MAFQVLHISDVHLQSDMSVDWIDKDKILMKVRQDERIQADCIIISGDLFNKGSLSKEASEEYKNFIEDLKKATAKKMNIAGREQEIKPIVLVVPGNHDLDRLARTKKDGSYNEFFKRSDFVRDAAEAMSEDRLFQIHDNQAEVLYQCAFNAFLFFAKKIGSKTFCEPDAALNYGKYEVQIQKVPFQQENEDAKKVRFVLLNTALFAGQSLSYIQFKDRKTKLKNEYKKKVNEGKEVEASKLALQIAQEQATYEKYGSFIVDEENFSTGNGRMGLSATGITTLRKMSEDSADRSVVCTIFVGHHGLEFLSKGTFKAISEVMARFHLNTEGDGVYLCGHAHRLQHSKYDTPENCELERIHQVQAGVLFGGDDGFAEYGFNYITIDYDDSTNETKITAEAYFRNKNHSQRDKWNQEELFKTVIQNNSLQQVTLPLPVREPIDNINSTNHEKYDDDAKRGQDKTKRGDTSSESSPTKGNACVNSSVESISDSSGATGCEDEQSNHARRVSKSLLGAW